MIILIQGQIVGREHVIDAFVYHQSRLCRSFQVIERFVLNSRNIGCARRSNGDDVAGNGRHRRIGTGIGQRENAGSRRKWIRESERGSFVSEYNRNRKCGQCRRLFIYSQSGRDGSGGVVRGCV